MDSRRHLRIRQLMDVTWSMPGEDIAGQGQIVNISATGILLQIDNSFRPLDQCVLSIVPEINEEKIPFLNKKGKVVWYRKTQSPHYHYQCGVEFLKDNILDHHLNDWMETKTAQMAGTMNASILNNYVV